MNRFKGLDLIDAVPEEISTEIRNTVDVTGGDQNHPQENKCKKAKCSF